MPSARASSRPPGRPRRTARPAPPDAVRALRRARSATPARRRSASRRTGETLSSTLHLPPWSLLPPSKQIVEQPLRAALELVAEGAPRGGRHVQRHRRLLERTCEG